MLVFFHGLFWSGLLSASSAYMTEVIPESRRAEGIGYWGMSTMLATAVAPAAGLWMYRHGWAWLCAGIALLNLVMAAIAWRLPPDTNVAARMSRDRLLGGSLVEWRVVAVTMALFLCSFGYGGITSFVAVMSDQHGIQPRSIFFTAFALTVLVTRVFSGRLADRVGHRRFLLPCLALVTVGLAATALAQTRLQLVLAAAVFGLGFGNQYPAFVGHVLKFVDPARRGAAFGGILAAFDTGIGTGSIATGWMAQHVGLRAAFGVGALLSAFSIPYFLWAEKRFLSATRSGLLAHRVEDRELLPDLAGEAGGQGLDLVHGLERDRVVEVLHVEGGHLPGERQGLRAVVEVARQLEAVHRARGQDAGLAPAVEHPLRVLRELVHVDHVGDRPQLVDGLAGPAGASGASRGSAGRRRRSPRRRGR